MTAQVHPRLARTLCLALLAHLLFSTALAGVRPLWEPDEGRYAECAREMARSGDWLVPTLSGEPHLTKPPLTYWLTALSLRCLGLTELAARLPNALAFAATVGLVLLLARRLGQDATAARAAAFVYATSALPFASGHILTTDTILTFFETAAMLAALETLGADTPRAAGRARLALWTALGLGFLTKGPPALLPLAILLALQLVRRDARALLALLAWRPLLVFGALALGWFACLVARQPDLLAYFAGAEFLQHVFTPAHKTPEPLWYFAPIVVGGALPWCLLWPVALRDALPAMRVGWRNAPASMQLLAAWIALPLASFTLARAKLPLYVLPVFPALALAVGPSVARFLGQLAAGRRLVRAAALAGAVAWWTLFGAFLAYPESAPNSRTFRAFAWSIRGALDRLPGEVHTVKTPIMHSIEYYLDRKVPSVDWPLTTLLATLAPDVERGARPILVLDGKRSRQLEASAVYRQAPAAFEVLARRNGSIAVRLLQR